MIQRADGYLTDAAIMASSKLRITTSDLRIYSDGAQTGVERFADSVQQGLLSFQDLTHSLAGFRRPTERISIYLSENAAASHVLGGYKHPLDPRPIIFLSSRAYVGFLRGSNATIFHELTHVHFWAYRSHTLREGFADFIALTLRPHSDVGPNSSSFQPSDVLFENLKRFVGTTRPAPRSLFSDRVYRQHYYYLSRLFVQYVIEHVGIREFMTLYSSARLAAIYMRLFRRTRGEIFDAAVRPSLEMSIP